MPMKAPQVSLPTQPTYTQERPATVVQRPQIIRKQPMMSSPGRVVSPMRAPSTMMPSTQRRITSPNYSPNRVVRMPQNQGRIIR